MMHPQSPGGDFLQNEFEYFFEQSLCGFLIADALGTIIRSNTKMSDWSGYTADELKGKKLTDLLSIGGKIYYETHLGPLLRMQGFFREVLLELKGVNGQRLRVLVNALECRDDNNNVVSIHYIVVEARDRLQYEQNLQIEKNIAEKELLTQKETVALREQLIAVMGHDLRNPLGAIGMALEVLQYSTTSESDSEIIATLRRSTSRMKELVSHIMDFARTRLGEGIILNRQKATLSPVLKQVVTELQLIYPTVEIITILDIDEPVDCDPNRIAQLVSNLLANALTHGSTGTPVYVRSFHHNGVLEISVSNNGEPIPSGLLQKLFTPFKREGNRPSQNGLGLGLYICAEIARAHHATLTCNSTAEETRFTFHMPSA